MRRQRVALPFRAVLDWRRLRNEVRLLLLARPLLPDSLT